MRALFYPRRARAIWPLLAAAGFRKPWWMPAAFRVRSALWNDLSLATALMPWVELVDHRYANGGACWCGTGRFKYDLATGNRCEAAFVAQGFSPPVDYVVQIDVTPFFAELDLFLEPPDGAFLDQR